MKVEGCYVSSISLQANDLVAGTRKEQHEEIGEAELHSMLTAINEEVKLSGGEQPALVFDINSVVSLPSE